ncbi:unnamed protein product, partial [Symbiodinium microadriaticum]
LLRRQLHKRQNQMALRIQNMFHMFKLNGLSGITRKVMRERKLVSYSADGDELLRSLVGVDNGSMTGPGCFYKSPGVRQAGELFQRALNQHTIYCTRYFSPDDCVMLGAVLRHPMCRTRRLVFHSVKGTSPNYEFDMIPSIRQCRSLRTVCILGGTWSVNFITALYKEVQTQNPMIQNVHVEGISGVKKIDEPVLLASVCNLLLDFFNYSVPGIQYLSLHGLGLLSQDMRQLAEGLGVNTSLQAIVLSLNMIEEDGFIELFTAIASNKRTALVTVDMSWNLVSMGDEVIHMFDNFSGPNLPGRCLHVNLCHNRIKTVYTPIREYRTDLVVTTIETEGVHKSGRTRDVKKARKAPYNTKPSGYRQLQKKMEAYPTPLGSSTM